MSAFTREDGRGEIKLTSDRDITLEADRDMDGAGDLVFKTGGVERARINAAGVGSGWPSVLGGLHTDYVVTTSGSTVTASAQTPGLTSYSGAATDAAAVIQQAVNALQATGGLIVFKGPLTFATQLTIYPNIAFMGAAPFGGTGSGTYGPVITSSYNGSCILVTGDSRGSTFPYLANFEIVGSHSLTSQNGIEINVSGGTVRDIFIDNVFIDNMGQHGLVFGGSSVKLHAYRLYIEVCLGNGFDGSSSAGSSTLELVDSYIAGNTGFGFVGPASGLISAITGGRFSSNTGGAISLPSSSTAYIIDGVFFDSNGDSTHPQIVIASATFSSARIAITGCDFTTSTNTNHITLAASNFVICSIANCGFNGSSGDAIGWTSRSGTRLLIENCLGYNDVRGKITNMFAASNRVGPQGTTSTPTASVAYQVEGAKLWLNVSGGTGVSITIADSAGNTLSSGLTSFTGILPPQYTINFGAFSVAPTVVAAVA